MTIIYQEPWQFRRFEIRDDYDELRREIKDLRTLVTEQNDGLGAGYAFVKNTRAWFADRFLLNTRISGMTMNEYCDLTIRRLAP